MTVQPGSDWNYDNCTSWCGDGNHKSDPACWGGDNIVLLSMEEGFPREAVEPYDVANLYRGGDAPTVGVYAYRAQPGYREVVYLHLSRLSDNEHLDLDCSVHLTGREAVQLANYLLGVAVTVDPVLGHGALPAEAINGIAEFVAEFGDSAAVLACPKCEMRGECVEHAGVPAMNSDSIRRDLAAAWEDVRAAGQLVSCAFPALNDDNRQAAAEIVAQLVAVEQALDLLLDNKSEALG